MGTRRRELVLLFVFFAQPKIASSMLHCFWEKDGKSKCYLSSQRKGGKAGKSSLKDRGVQRDSLRWYNAYRLFWLCSEGRGWNPFQIRWKHYEKYLIVRNCTLLTLIKISVENCNTRLPGGTRYSFWLTQWISPNSEIPNRNQLLGSSNNLSSRAELWSYL